MASTPTLNLMRTVLFVCTGNTCRSPIAESIARAWLGRGSLGDPQAIFIASAGVAAVDGAPTSPEAVEALRRIGIEHDGASKALTAEMIRGADLVLCMTRQHAEAARSLVAGEDAQTKKVVLLDPRGDIPDPVGQSQGAYDALTELLTELIPVRLKETLRHEDRDRSGSPR